jgi:hypothetical protein
MATKNFTRLFTISVLLFVLVGCGGKATSTPASLPTITAAQVFTSSMIGQTWTFQNGYGDLTTIAVESAPAIAAGLAGNKVVFHYRKSNARSYWAPGIPDAELWFVLHQQPDGSWSSTASLINFPKSCSFCTDPPNWKTLTSDVHPVPGMPMPYGIIPASASGTPFIVDTAYQSHTIFNDAEPDFDDISLTQPANAPFPWRNSFYVESVTTPIFSGSAIVSEQWEGPCFPAPGCAHEKWYFAPGLGLVKVVPINIGAGDNADSNLTMVRIS